METLKSGDLQTYKLGRRFSTAWWPTRGRRRRGLRRILGQCRFSPTSSSKSDQQVRRELGVVSMQCLLTQRRLMLLATVLQQGSSQLHNLLSATYCGKRLPWVALVLQDLENLKAFHAPKLDALGELCTNAAEWVRCIITYPQWWKTMVSDFALHTMALDIRVHAQEAAAVDRFKCERCGDNFRTKKALQSHMRAAHKTTNGTNTLEQP